MLVNDFIKRVSTRLGDSARVTFEKKELISAVNDAITQLSLERIAANDPLMIEELEITPGRTSVPAGFRRFAGQEPFYIAGTTFQSLDGSEDKRTARAYVCKAHIETTGDELPFDDATSLGYLLDYVVELVGARVGYTSQTEAGLADKMSAAYAGGSAGNANPERQE